MITIQLNRMLFDAMHGVYEKEHNTQQRFQVDISLGVDAEASTQSDNLSDTFDYTIFQESVAEIMNGEHVDLIEFLGNKIANAAFADNRVRAATVEISKLDAWGGGDNGYPSVVIKRNR